jgi:hypothetical protein
MDGETITLIIIVCCIVSCIVGLLVWATGGDSGTNKLDLSGLVNWIPFTSTKRISIPRETGGEMTVNGFTKYRDFTVNPMFKIGTPVSGKNIDACSSLCVTTNGCRGFSMDTGCQLYNNVIILDRTKGSSVYASADLDGVKYLHVPFGATALPPEISNSPVNGTLADTVGKCQKDRKNGPCGGFVFSGTTGKMYSKIPAIDITQAGDSYMDIDKKPQFIREGNYDYGTGSSSQWTAPASWLLSMNETPTNNNDWFAVWSSPGFDAGTDSKGAAAQSANTLTVSSLSSCQDACMGNAWCKSFTFGGNQCYMRHDTVAQHFPATDRGSGQACIPSGAPYNCTCGVRQGGCNFNGCCNDNYDNPSEGKNGTAKTSYVKKMPPLDIACPVSCSQDERCILATNNTTTCNQYNSAPATRTPNPSMKATWMFDNYPN